jgi:hypothetical protein
MAFKKLHITVTDQVHEAITENDEWAELDNLIEEYFRKRYNLIF